MKQTEFVCPTCGVPVVYSAAETTAGLAKKGASGRPVGPFAAFLACRTGHVHRYVVVLEEDVDGGA